MNKAIGINYIDTYSRRGLYPPPSLPTGLGTEAAGMVSQVGRNLTHLAVGDRVVYAQSALGAYSTVHNILADKAVKLPDSISFEQAAASFLKGLTVYYLLRKTYSIEADEPFLFHAAAGGVGLIACQWAKAPGAKHIGTVGYAEKAERVRQAGAWQTINYRDENIAQRLVELNSGNKVAVVYHSVGKDSWEASLDCLQPPGLMISFGNSSGPVTDVNLAILNQKGSLYTTRPSINGYITTRKELSEASNALLTLIANGEINVDVAKSQVFTLDDAVRAHQILESRTTQDSSLLIP